MDCGEARLELHALNVRRLDPGLEAAVRGHLEGCEGCRRAAEAEAVLDALLAERLPRHDAPPALRRRIAEVAAEATGGAARGAAAGAPGKVGEEPSPRMPAREPRSVRTWRRPARATAAVAAALALVATGAVVGRSLGGVAVLRGAEGGALALLVGEAVNDHLRVLASERPMEVASGGTHQVKPWFEGRLDFAPVVPDGQDAALQLRGGAVGYFLDRKAAVLGYRLRLHQVTLLAFRAEGLAWPAGAATEVGSARGFNVVLWRAGELGYALVSDVNAGELAEVARALVPATLR